jgi:hypothetical protein
VTPTTRRLAARRKIGFLRPPPTQPILRTAGFRRHAAVPTTPITVYSEN